MKPSTRGRISLAQQKRANSASLSFLAAASPKALSEDAREMASMAGVNIDAIHRKRKDVRGVGEPYEAQIQASILEYLAHRADIKFLVRHNSGQAVSSNVDGSSRYTQFHRIYGRFEGTPMRMPDISCYQVIGRGSRPVMIEVKRGTFKAPSNTREHEQAASLACIRSIGGLGFFATSLQQVIDNLGDGK